MRVQLRDKDEYFVRCTNEFMAVGPVLYADLLALPPPAKHIKQWVLRQVSSYNLILTWVCPSFALKVSALASLSSVQFSHCWITKTHTPLRYAEAGAAWMPQCVTRVTSQLINFMPACTSTSISLAADCLNCPSRLKYVRSSKVLAKLSGGTEAHSLAYALCKTLFFLWGHTFVCLHPPPSHSLPPR